MTIERGVKVGDRVRCGVYVGGEWRPLSLGVVVGQSFDGTVSDVDVMSLHGGAPWVRKEVTSHLRLEADERPECTCSAADMHFGRCCKVKQAQKEQP